jgi:hypothetical protein
MPDMQKAGDHPAFAPPCGEFFPELGRFARRLAFCEFFNGF